MAENFATTFSLNDQMSAALKSIIKNVEQLDKMTDSLQKSLDVLDDSSFNELNSSLNNVSSGLVQVDKSTNQVKKSLDSVKTNSFNTVSKEAGGLNQALNELDRDSSGVKSSLDSIQTNAFNNVSQDVNKLDSTLSGINRRAAEVKGDLNKLDGTSFSGLRSESNKTASEVKEIGDAARKAESDLSKLKDVDVKPKGLDDLEEQLAGLGDAIDLSNFLNLSEIVTGIAEGMGNVVSSAMDAAETMGNANNTFKIGLDLSAPDLDAIKDQTFGAYLDNYGESYQDLVDKATYAKQLMGEKLEIGDTGDLLKKMTTLEGASNDYQETLRGLNNFSLAFGDTWQHTADLITVANQNGMNFSDELGDNLAEYSSLFKGSGFSGEEFLAIGKIGKDTGAYNLDKIYDFMKEFNIVLSDGTMAENMSRFGIATQEAFINLQNHSGTAKDVFNAMLSDLSKMSAMDQKSLLSDVFSSLGEDNSAEAILAMQNYEQVAQETFGNVEGAAQKAADANGTAVGQLKRYWEAVPMFLAPIGEGIAELLLAPIEGFQAIGEFLSPVFDAIGQAMQPVFDALQPAFDWFAQNGELVRSVIVGIGTGLAVFAGLSFLPALISGITTVVGILTGALGALWAVLIANPITLVITLIAAFAAGIAYAWNNSETFRNVVTSAWEAVKAAFASAWEYIQGIFASLSAKWNEAVVTVQNFWSNITATVSGWWTEAQQWGTNVIEGFKQGLQNAWGSVTSWFSESWNWVTEQTKSIFQIGSPSKVFDSIGGDLIAGFKGGLEGAWSSVTSWFSSAWEGIKSTAQSWGDTIAGWFGGGGGEESSGQQFDYSETINNVNAQMEQLKANVAAAFTQIQETAFTTNAAVAQQTMADYMNLGLQIVAQTGMFVGQMNAMFLGLDLTLIGTTLTTQLTAIFTTMQTLAITAIGTLVSGISVALQPLMTAFTEIFNQIITMCLGALQTLYTQTVTLLNNVAVSAMTILGTLQEAVTNCFTNLTQVAILQINILVATVTSAFSSMVGLLTSSLSSLSSTLAGLWEQIKAAAINVMNEMAAALLTTIAKLCADLISELAVLPPALNAVGKEMMSSLRSGIDSQRSSVINKASDIVQALKTTFQTGLGIHSPSDFMIWIGQMMLAGLMQGMSPSEVQSFVSSTIENMRTSFKNGKFNPDELVDFMGEGTMDVVRYLEFIGDQTLPEEASNYGKPAIIQEAEKYLGYVSPGGHGGSMFGARYGNGGAWCGSFVKYCADNAGVPIGAGNPHYVPDMLAWARASGRSTNIPVPGYAAIFGGASHIELVADVLPDGNVVCIGGNTGSPPGVYERVRNGATSYIALDGGHSTMTLKDTIQQAYFKKMGIGAFGPGVSLTPDMLRSAMNVDGSGLLNPSWFQNWWPDENVSRWAGDVLQVLAMLGQPASLLKGVLWAIEGESGGNPNDVNTWDINARMGTPSKGLLQTIQPNYDRWHNPQLPDNIFDPKQNIWTCLREMQDVYGGIANLINRKIARGKWSGYAVGTRYVPADMLAMIHEGEAIIPANQNPYSKSGGDYLYDLVGNMVEARPSEASQGFTSVTPSETGASVVTVGDFNVSVYVQGSNSSPQEIAEAIKNEIWDDFRLSLSTKSGV